MHMEGQAVRRQTLLRQWRQRCVALWTRVANCCGRSQPGAVGAGEAQLSSPQSSRLAVPGTPHPRVAVVHFETNNGVDFFGRRQSLEHIRRVEGWCIDHICYCFPL